MSEPTKKTTIRPLRPQAELFTRLVAEGVSHTKAYRKAYGRPRVSSSNAANAAYRILKSPAVQRRLASLQAKAEGNTLLTVNERLKLLSEGAKAKIKTASDRNARARCIEVYNKTAGDHAPERHEHTVTTPPGAPFEIAPARPVTAKAKIAALVAAKLQAKEEVFE